MSCSDSEAVVALRENLVLTAGELSMAPGRL